MWEGSSIEVARALARRMRMFALAMVAVSVVQCALAAAPAAAHAILQGSSPARDATTTGAVDQVVLDFNEPVRVAFGGVGVYGPDGGRVDDGRARASGHRITVKVKGSDSGTYAVSYRVVSADGHTVTAAYVFNVRHASRGNTALDRAASAARANRPLDATFRTLRGVSLLLLLLAGGGMVFATWVAPGWQPRGYRMLLLASALAFLLAFVASTALSSGFGLREVLHASVLGEEARTAYGRMAAIEIALCLFAFVWSFGFPPRAVRPQLIAVMGALPVLTAVALHSIGGHAIASGVHWVRLPLDMVHTLAAAAWIGGLAQLVVMTRSADTVDGPAVRRFSRLALGSVIAIVATGLYATWVEAGLSVDAYLDTTYGLLLLAKMLLLVLVLVLANVNRTRHVPVIVREGGSATAARTGMRTYAMAELVLLVLVIAATAWLVQSVPARDAITPPRLDTTIKVGGGEQVQFVIDPARAGRNEVHLYATNQRGEQDDAVTAMTLAATSTERHIGPLDIPLLAAGPGHFTNEAATIPYAGTWKLRLSVQKGEFEEHHTTFTAKIAPRR